MNQPSFKKISQMTRDTAEIAKQNQEIADNVLKELQLKAQYLEIERMKFEADKHADIKHDLKQCIDFAINSLPWWRRSPRTVVDRATEFLLMLKLETAKHVAMDVLAQKIQTESLEQFTADTEKVLDEVIGTVNTVSTDDKGNTAIHATVNGLDIHATMDREGAEMEIK